MRNLVILIILVVLAGCESAQSEQFYSRAEIYEMAKTVDTIKVKRNQLGIADDGPHSRTYSKVMRRDWSCVYTDVTTEFLGTFKAALCMPQTCRSLPPTTVITFLPSLGFAREQGWQTIPFVTNQSTQRQCDRAHLKRFGYGSEAFRQKDDRP